MRQSYIVYDVEIVNGVCDTRKGDTAIPGVKYCEGWHDHKGMGLSVCGVYDGLQGRYRMFGTENLSEMFALMEQRNVWVTFNGIGFDDKVLAATAGRDLPPFHPHTRYDILAECRQAAGIRSGPSKGYGLDDMARRTLKASKGGNGMMAPVNWQRGLYATVIDYNLTDVWLTTRLFKRVLAGAVLVGPDGDLKLPVPKVLQRETA